MVEEDIKNIETYDPTNVPDKELRDDWRIVTAWYSQILMGREFTYSKEQVINIASLVFKELEKRGTKFKPEKMKPNAKRLFEIVSKGKLKADDEADRELARILKSGENLGCVITLEDVLPIFKDFYITKPYIHLVGGLANHPKDGTTGDIDILIREKKPLGNERLPMMFRFYRMFPKDMWPRLQILWANEDYGPFTNHVPLYDQLIERRDDSTKIVLMSEEEDDMFDFEPPDTMQDPADAHIRSTSPAILKAAKVSKEKGIKPGRFFQMLKGISGYRKNEVFSIKGVLELVNQKDYPFEVDEKFDGMRVQIHKDGLKVKILSLDGADLTPRLSFMADELKKKKGDFVIDAEITGWEKGFRKGEHLGRSDVAGFIHAKTPLPHKNFFANTFDIVYRGGDLHGKPLSERRKALEGLGSTDHVRVIQMQLAKNPTELSNSIKWASKFPGSEGAMIKSWRSTYPLGGSTSKWVKFKKEVDLDAEVLEITETKTPGTFNYLMVLRDGKGDPVPVGRTYNTSIKAKKGDIIRVAFVNLNMYTDPDTKKVWFNWWSPRVLELREDKNKPDTDVTARAINKATDGEVGEKKFPKRYAAIMKVDTVNDFLLTYPDGGLDEISALFDLTEDEIRELTTKFPIGGMPWMNNEVFDANPFLTPGKESEKWKFVVQNHYRGKSVHQDLRLERPSFLVGWTLNIQKAGKPGKDIDTMAEAHAFEKNAGNIKPMTFPHQVVIEKKAPEPKVWLTVNEVFEPGQIGATKEHEGVFSIVADGEVEFGTQKPTFHEYWLHDNKKTYSYNGRFVTRLLKNPFQKEEGKKAGRGAFVWFARFPKEQRPYILSRKAVKDGTMPPIGLSWLPKFIRDQVPNEYRYWTLKSKAAAKKTRDSLFEAMKKDVVLKFGDTPDVTDIKIAPHPFPSGGKSTLSHLTWRGPIVVRLGPSRQEWHLFLEDGNKVTDIILDMDPTENSSVPAVFAEPKTKDLLSKEGEIKPKTELNPDKETMAFLKILEKGTYKTEVNEPNRKVIVIKGSGFKGKFELARQRQKSLWVFTRLSDV